MELPENPYQPPTTAVPFSSQAAATGDPDLATRGSRLAASMIDGFLIMAIIFPCQWWAGVYKNFPAVQQDSLTQVLWGFAGFGIMLLLNGFFLATRAQTIGKVVMGIKIVTLDGKNADLRRIVLRRILPLAVVGVIPVVGGLASTLDSLSIFRGHQRCIHDQIAGTRVVRV